jgi:hypothetical protein
MLENPLHQADRPTLIAKNGPVDKYLRKELKIDLHSSTRFND